MEYLLGLCGPRVATIKSLILATLETLVAQQFIIEAATWSIRGNSEGTLRTYLSAVLGKRSNWAEEKIDGDWAVAHVRRLNNIAHHPGTTSGANKYRRQVEALQKGAYCFLCGRKSDLQVDHIVPVRMGGDPDDTRNMQLLCGTCNAAKADFDDFLLPTILRTRCDRAISPAQRLKVLVMNAASGIGNRLQGKCSCGKRSNEARLRVVVDVPLAAANTVMLKIVCDRCSPEPTNG
jgi:hypothetical protein